jgi:mannosyltransferase
VSSTPTGQDDKTSASGGREGTSVPQGAGAGGREGTSAPRDAGAAEREGTSAPRDAGAAEREGTSAPGAADAGGPSRAGTPAAIAARYAPPAAAAAAMTAAGLWGLTRDSAMGNDEVVSRWAALLSLRQLAHLLRHVDAVHGLYYLLLHGWMAVGTSPTVMRIPSVIFMAAAAAMVAILGRRLTGSGWAGFFSGLIMALTPSITYYAQTARSYALVFACVLAATLALLHALAAEQAGAPRPRLVRRWLAYGALVTLGGYLNELSLLVLAAHAVTVLLARYGRRTAAHWAAAAAAGAVLVGPLAVLSSRQRAALGPIPRPGWHDVWVLYHNYFGATVAAAALLAACAVIALLPPRGWLRRQGGDAAESGAAPEVPWWSSGGISLPSVAAPLLVVPATLLLLESAVGSHLYVDRYVLYGEAGAALLAGGGMYRLGQWLAGMAGRKTLVWVPGVAVCVCALLLQLTPLHRVRTPDSRLFNFGGPAFYIEAHSRPGDGVMFFNSFFRKARLGYPSQYRKTSDFAMAVSPEIANPFRGINKPFAAVRPLMLSHQRIWVVGLRPSVTLSVGPVQEESMVLEQDFTRTAVKGYRNVWVTLWLRR